jgi:hypothetical protein
MKTLVKGSLITALVVLAVGIEQAPPTDSEAKALLAETFPGTGASVVEVRQEEPRVVMPERYGSASFIVHALLSGIGEPFEVEAHVSSSRTGWRLRYVEHRGLMMSPEELFELIQGDRQRRTMEQMRDLATALGVMRVATGRYASYVVELQELGHMPDVPVNDAWGNPWVYESSAPDTYTLISLGADGAEGPAPPAPWLRAPYDPDIIISDGAFTQAPTSR